MDYPFLLDGLNNLSPPDNDYRLNHIVMSSRMIRQLQRGRRKVIYTQEYYLDNYLPQVGELLYIAEPFLRRYGVGYKGMIVPHSILYSDNAEKILAQVEELPDRERYAANAMREQEARYFIRVKRVQYRVLKSLIKQIKEIIHDSLGDAQRKDRVLLIEFEMASDEEVQDWYNRKHADELFDVLF